MLLSTLLWTDVKAPRGKMKKKNDSTKVQVRQQKRWWQQEEQLLRACNKQIFYIV